MREEVTIDLRNMWAKLEKLPEKTCYQRGRVLTNDEEWMVWLMYPRKRQKLLAKEMSMGSDTLRTFYEGLKAQGGPKGERPEWMM